MDLFSTISLEGVQFKNRAVMAPMVLNFAETDGSVTKAFRDFYLARARGGDGYIDTVLGPFDSIVTAVRYRGDTRWSEALKAQMREKVIGDAAQPRAIREAITEGIDDALSLGD